MQAKRKHLFKYLEMSGTKKQHNKRKQTPTTHGSVWELCPFKQQGNPSSEMGWRSLAGHNSHNSWLFCSLSKGYPQNLYILCHCIKLPSSMLPFFPQIPKIIGKRDSVCCILAFWLWESLCDAFSVMSTEYRPPRFVHKENSKVQSQWESPSFRPMGVMKKWACVISF